MIQKNNYHKINTLANSVSLDKKIISYSDSFSTILFNTTSPTILFNTNKVPIPSPPPKPFPASSRTIPQDLNTEINSSSPKKHPDDGMLDKALKLLFVKIGIMVLTQPIQVVMRVQQNSAGKEKIYSITGAMRYINQGSTSFLGRLQRYWGGGGWAVVKETVKFGTYKTPIMLKAPDFATQLLDTSFTRALSDLQQHTIISMGGGVIASATDTAFGGGLDRVSAYYALKQGDQSGASILKEMRAQGSWIKQLLFLNQGFVPTFCKSFMNFGVLYGLRGPVETSIYKYSGLKTGDPVPSNIDFNCAITTGVLAASASAPFDAVKAMAQAPGAKNRPLLETLKNNVINHGIRGAFPGLGLKGVQAIIGWTAASLILQRKSTVSNTPLRVFSEPENSIW